MHKRYEELCTLAVTGQITPDAMASLDQHVRKCAECGSFLQDLSGLKANVAPVVAATHSEMYDPPDRMRERFLKRASLMGLRLNAGPVMAIPNGTDVPSLTAPARLRDIWAQANDRLHASCAVTLRYALPIAACLVCAIGGYFIAQRRTVTTAAAITAAPAATPRVTIGTARQPDVVSAHWADLERQRAEVQHRLDALSAELRQVIREKLQLSDQLAAAAQRETASEDFRKQFQIEAQKLQQADNQIAKLQANLNAERDKRAILDAVAVAQQNATQEADAKLAAVQAELARERATQAAKSDAGEMIAARNLHIIDVYDTGSDGQRQRPFGRVFYIEGQSLVFYAYDLAGGKHTNTKIAFHVWGETAGVKTASYSLGIMRNDGAAPDRWKLTFDDPKVLARINAVYVTAQPGAKQEPEGRKLMYAFLGTPNHP
jgi:hypothetical protein